jgi:hypothetical protein
MGRDIRAVHHAPLKGSKIHSTPLELMETLTSMKYQVFAATLTLLLFPSLSVAFNLALALIRVALVFIPAPRSSLFFAIIANIATIMFLSSSCLITTHLVLWMTKLTVLSIVRYMDYIMSPWSCATVIIQASEIVIAVCQWIHWVY